MKYGETGTLIEATLRSEDLIPAFVNELIRLDHEERRPLRSIALRVKKASENVEKYGSYWDSEEASFDMEWLENALQEHAKPYFYFGAHPGDGSDFGFWLSEGFEQDILDNGGIKVADTADVPADFEGEVLHVSDHGNPTLYACEKGGKLTEIWGVV